MNKMSGKNSIIHYFMMVFSIHVTASTPIWPYLGTCQRMGSASLALNRINELRNADEYMPVLALPLPCFQWPCQVTTRSASTQFKCLDTRCNMNKTNEIYHTRWNHRLTSICQPFPMSAKFSRKSFIFNEFQVWQRICSPSKPLAKR